MQALCSVATNGLDVICLTQDTLHLYQTQARDQEVVGLMIRSTLDWQVVI